MDGEAYWILPGGGYVKVYFTGHSSYAMANPEKFGMSKEGLYLENAYPRALLHGGIRVVGWIEKNYKSYLDAFAKDEETIKKHGTEIKEILQNLIDECESLGLSKNDTTVSFYTCTVDEENYKTNERKSYTPNEIYIIL